MTPTELRAAIEARPDLAALWADVFPAEPEPPAGSPERPRWERIRGRFGTLKPDPAYEIARALAAAGRPVSPEQVAAVKGGGE